MIKLEENNTKVLDLTQYKKITTRISDEIYDHHGTGLLKLLPEKASRMWERSRCDKVGLIYILIIARDIQMSSKKKAKPNRESLFENPQFDGETYNEKEDQERLKGQIKRVYNLMNDGRWRTLGDIANHTKDPQQSISARLRDLRKDKFGAHNVERQSVGNGLYLYRLN